MESVIAWPDKLVPAALKVTMQRAATPNSWALNWTLLISLPWWQFSEPWVSRQIQRFEPAMLTRGGHIMVALHDHTYITCVCYGHGVQTYVAKGLMC